MDAERPRTLDELSAIHGVGAAKLQKYGAAFLAAIRGHADA
jgi:superfamily II DNA helicase RecQ